MLVLSSSSVLGQAVLVITLYKPAKALHSSNWIPAVAKARNSHHGRWFVPTLSWWLTKEEKHRREQVVVLWNQHKYPCCWWVCGRCLVPTNFSSRRVRTITLVRGDTVSTVRLLFFCLFFLLLGQAAYVSDNCALHCFESFLSLYRRRHE